MDAMTCTDCQRAASVWHWGGYRADCPDCQIRAIATSPKHIRDAAYDQAEARVGRDAAKTIRERVSAEYKRISSLRGISI